MASGYFIYSEINTYLSQETGKDNDAKLLKTGSFITQLYEAESLSKLALQHKTEDNFTAYSQKIDSISIEIESLKLLTNNENQRVLLDSVQGLLKQKLQNMTDSKAQRFLAEKETQINANDLDLSQQLRTIISAFEQEVLVSSYNDNLKKQSALKRSIRLAGFAALLGLIIVSIFAFLINRDFWRIQTYRQKLEKEKKYSESLLKSREQLISTVSHDLRTPINTITGYTELMTGTDLSQKQERYLSTVKSSADYVNRLVNDLLEFSKLEGGKLNIEKIPFIAAHLIQETAEKVISRYRLKPQKSKEIQFKRKFKLQILASALQKKSKHLIFNEFTQAESNTDKKFGGYGLGLTISKKLTELLNGSLKLVSKTNEGSTFTIQLPLEITYQSDTKHLETAYLVPKLKMLIIDDDTALLGMLQELAESLGITVNTFTNFLQVDKDSHLAYDLVLTDIQMPQITGFEVLEKLKSGIYKHYTEQPIIAMTGRKDLDAEAYTTIGFNQVLEKPFSKRELISMLKLLGFETEQAAEIKVDEIQNTSATKKEVTKHYSLEIIHSFLGTNEDAVYDVLQTFLRDTKTNMNLLEEGINAIDYPQINAVGHRMLPMFRQLKVMPAVPILERFELAKPSNMNIGKLLDSMQLLQRKVNKLTTEIESKLTTIQVYSD
ncbi:Hybrid signal transduction histidine kinase J [Nymphon striatum]|nr:Hybrid signal transduction histidine kinase J [Nymphon striatum]